MLSEILGTLTGDSSQGGDVSDDLKQLLGGSADTLKDVVNKDIQFKLGLAQSNKSINDIIIKLFFTPRDGKRSRNGRS